MGTWELRSPTIIVQVDLPSLCFTHQWVLCLPNDMEINDLTNNLALLHQKRKHDSLIIHGEIGHEELLKEFAIKLQTMFSSNSPVFMPTEYSSLMSLRLDSNIVFYEKAGPKAYKLMDKFAVKGGSPITLYLGDWDTTNGINLYESLNKYDRRTDLKGAAIINGIYKWSMGSADLLRDKKGNLIGSKGYYQDYLFYITEALKLSVEPMEVVYSRVIFDNGSWDGVFGALQRNEIDVAATQLGVNLQRTEIIDYPIPINSKQLKFLAAKSSGRSPDMWVYVEVFGLHQWGTILAMFTLMAICLSLVSSSSQEGDSELMFGVRKSAKRSYQLDSLSSRVALIGLYTLQMGSHIDSKQMSLKVLTLTISMPLLLLWCFYTTDITAWMTSGPAKIPIRGFEDVLHHGFRVVSTGGYYKGLLANAKSAAGIKVYNDYFESTDSSKESLISILEDPKKLMYTAHTTSSDPELKPLYDQCETLEIQNSKTTSNAIVLPRNSEFLQIFNHYILKAHETGMFHSRGLFRTMIKYYDVADYGWNWNEDYQTLADPQPLDFTNVMFCFICLASGMVLSISTAAMESIVKKFVKKSN